MIISKVVSRYDKFSILQIDLQMLTTEPFKPINFTMHQLFILFCGNVLNIQIFRLYQRKRSNMVLNSHG